MTFTTLCYIEKDDSYLMLHRIRKEHDINKDKWIGIGGHFETGESPEDCLKREALEETGLTLTSFRFRGIVTFLCDGITDYYMCLYTADGFTGTLTDCSEGTLEWVPKNRLTELNLWEGDLIFFKLMENPDAPFFSLKLRYENNVLLEAVLNGSPMELLDLIDKDGNPTGRTRERSLVHRYGDRHRASHVWIVRTAKGGGFDVLLQKRSPKKDSFPGCYDISSAGHVPAGSSFPDTALRELEEELGLTVSGQQLSFLGMLDHTVQSVFHGRPFFNHELSAIYALCLDPDPEALTLQPEEVESVLWIGYDVCLKKMRDGSLSHCIFPDEFELLGKWLKN